MTPTTGFAGVLQGWRGRGVVIRHDPPTGAWIFVALHDDTLGQPVGGTRMKVYGRPEDGLLDAMRLAEGMTRKWAVLDLPFGGGKAVIALSRPLAGQEERRQLLARYGALLDTLQGAFGTGEDLGTTPEDMAFLASVSRQVVGPGAAPPDPGPYTALGVLAGIKAALGHAFRDPVVRGRRILVQGVGDVGRRLAELLAREGAEVLVADVDEARAAAVAAELAGTVVSPSEALRTPCEVLAPCAVGGVLDAGSIPSLRCRIVAGSANNQLGGPADAEALRARGILYAPDYVINGGGALALGRMSLGEPDGPGLRRRLEGIGDVLTEIFREARERDVSPLDAAEERVSRILARGPASG